MSHESIVRAAGFIHGFILIPLAFWIPTQLNARFKQRKNTFWFTTLLYVVMISIIISGYFAAYFTIDAFAVSVQSKVMLRKLWIGWIFSGLASYVLIHGTIMRVNRRKKLHRQRQPRA
jgi:membrane protein implicated in regulation of membrane protease activity